MELLKIYPENPNDKYISMAAKAIKNGKIVIIPTDSVYAFACDALNNSAIEHICKVKGIKSEKNNLSIICNEIGQAAEYARIDNDTYKIMKRNLPGAFTFILPALSKLPKAFKGRKTVGIRIPDNNIALALVRLLGNPIMTSSVPLQDEDTSTEPELMAKAYPGVEIILDSGRGNTIPSTVIDCTEDNIEIIREGTATLAL